MSRLSGCVISGINTAVFVSPHSAPDRAAARPPRAAGASHLGTDAIRPWESSSHQAQGTGPRQGCLEATEVQVLQSQEGSRNLQVFSLRNGVGHRQQDNLELWEVRVQGPWEGQRPALELSRWENEGPGEGNEENTATSSPRAGSKPNSVAQEPYNHGQVIGNLSKPQFPHLGSGDNISIPQGSFED